MNNDIPVALVTGASRGIGRGIAVALARAGFAVAINYARNTEAAEEAMALCIEASPLDDPAGYFLTFQADISSGADRENLLAGLFETFGRVDHLVNNAGVAPKIRSDITEANEESFDRLITTNLKGPYFLTQRIARHWLEQPAGAGPPQSRSIIFVTSVSAGTASVSRGDYCISKAGLSMAAKLWAARLAGEGIPVYELRPGIIETDMTAGVKSAYGEKIGNGLVPQKRWGIPEDIGRAAASLLRGDFSFSTGSIINVDGGLNLSIL
jgi:3-oxoacyl-[acyl-carrier protein] reductase